MKKLFFCVLCACVGMVSDGCKKDPVPSGGGSGFNSTKKNVEVNGVSFNMVLVKGGTFWMGAQADDPAGRNYDSLAYKNEKPVHQVSLSDYYIGETEVTQALWEAVMGSNHAANKGEKLPMVQVTTQECESFIEKLNQLTGMRFRLPTEAEWEFAARDGNNNRQFLYAGSNNWEEVAWCSDNSGKESRVVKTKKCNLLGIYDMSGNVFEFCQDLYGAYSSAAQENPTGPKTGDSVVIRGGSYSSVSKLVRVTYRYGIRSLYDRYSNVGFRLVLEVPLYSERDSADGLHCQLKDVKFVMKAVTGGMPYLGAQSKEPSGRNYDKNAKTEESPVHQVRITGFYMGETEVTQALWETVMGENPSYHKGADLPVENVSIETIEKEFLPKLNKYSEIAGRKFRLPSEAEWEYAARGGQNRKETRYAGDTAAGNVAWYKDNSGGASQPVRRKKANELGLYDMSGNVSEFCRDGMRNYSTSANKTDPLGSTSYSDRALRGGSWYDGAGSCRVSARKSEGSRSNTAGFRLVCEWKY